MATSPGNATNDVTTGICGFTGTAFTATPVTQYNTIVGGATSSTLVNVAPSATAGVPLVSAGAAANPAYGTAVVAGGGTGLTSTTAYAVLCGGTTSTGNLQSIASVGTAGHILTSNGDGALPTFQASAAASGALVYLSIATAANSSSVVFTGISSTYLNYLFVFTDILAATDSVQFWMRTSTDGGATYDSGVADYGWAYQQIYPSASGLVSDISDSEIQIAGDNSGNDLSNVSTETLGGTLILSSPSLANKIKVSFNTCFVNENSLPNTCVGAGARLAAADVNAVQFLMSSGNITSGTIRMYGIANS